jgi:hypothetical protein
MRDFHRRFERSIKACLYRCCELRRLDAPRLLVRNEQLFLWCLRQMRRYQYDPRHIAPCDVPGYHRNYQKFIRIHETGQTAH